MSAPERTEEHPLKTLRLEHNPRYESATALAKAAGVAHATVLRAEASAPIGLLAATRIAAALGLTVEELAEKLPGNTVTTA